MSAAPPQAPGPSARRRLRRLAEDGLCRLFGVVQFEDLYERAALSPLPAPLLRALAGKTLMDDIGRAPFLFIHVPKNGGHSVQSLLYSQRHPHASIRHYRLFFPDWVATRPSLAVIRDPLDRFLSSYDFAIGGGGSAVAVRDRALRRMGPVGSVDDFLDFLEREAADWTRVDASARPQWWYVCDAAGTIAVSDLCLLDGDNAALRRFLARFGLAQLPHVNRTARRTHSLAPAQEARVRRLYAADFAIHAAVQARDGHADDLMAMPLDRLMREPGAGRAGHVR